MPRDNSPGAVGASAEDRMSVGSSLMLADGSVSRAASMSCPQCPQKRASPVISRPQDVQRFIAIASFYPQAYQVTVISCAPPENVIVAVSAHDVLSVSVIVTCTFWPGSNTPLAGLKVKFTGLPDLEMLGALTVQLNCPCALGSSVSVTVHV